MPPVNPVEARVLGDRGNPRARHAFPLEAQHVEHACTPIQGLVHRGYDGESPRPGIEGKEGARGYEGDLHAGSPEGRDDAARDPAVQDVPDDGDAPPGELVEAAGCAAQSVEVE